MPAVRALRDPAVQAFALFNLGGLFFVVINIGAKALTPELGPVTVIWLRYLVHVLLVAVCFPRTVPGLVHSSQRGAQIGRSVLLMLSTVFNFTALTFLPLADVAAIIFTAPLIVAGLAMLLLGERVGVARWLAIGLGFMGALLIVRPGMGAFNAGVPLAFGCAVAYALYQVSTRLVREAEPLVSLLYSGLAGLAVSTVLVPWLWQAPTPGQWLLAILMGACGAFGHLLVIMALQRAEASRLSPWTYLQLLWALLASLVVFGDVPSPPMLAGVAVIVGSGLWIWRLGRADRPAPGPGAGPGR
jgi:drug/metabolite transporter (DMT)-like permease